MDAKRKRTDNSCRDTGSYDERGNIVCHDCLCADDGSMTDTNPGHYEDIHTDPYIIFNDHRTRRFGLRSVPTWDDINRMRLSIGDTRSISDHHAFANRNTPCRIDSSTIDTTIISYFDKTILAGRKNTRRTKTKSAKVRKGIDDDTSTQNNASFMFGETRATKNPGR